MQPHTLAAEVLPVPGASASTPSRLVGFAKSVPALVLTLLSLDVLCAVSYVVTRHARDLVGKGVVSYFSLDGEGNLPSWYSAGKLLLVGLMLLAFGCGQLQRGARAAWALVLGGLLFLFLSLDETTGLHERFGYWLDAFTHGRKQTLLASTGFWMIVAAPLFVAAVALLAWSAWHYLRGRPGVIWRYAAGFTIFLAAAAGLELLGNFIPPGTTAARVQVLFEELGEMVGATVLLWATMELMASHGVTLMVTRDGPADGR